MIGRPGDQWSSWIDLETVHDGPGWAWILSPAVVALCLAAIVLVVGL